MPRCVLFLVALAGLAGCASPSPGPAYRSESFDVESPFVTWVSRGPEGACELGKRALLSQGYRVEAGKPAAVRGEKYFLPKRDFAMTLSITLVCLPSNLGAAVYATALETRYELKSASSNTGVSVAGVGSISVPWASDQEAQIKVGEETIADPDFYHRLFALIESLGG